VVNERKLRKGFTTGTCAAAASKAAAMALKESGVRGRESEIRGLRSEVRKEVFVEVGLPSGERVTLRAYIKEIAKDYAVASVVKDAGDDPDITNGAEIVAKVKRKSEGGCQKSEEKQQIVIKGGKGVGVVTKPGLQIPVGEPAINPVPRRMISEAVREVLGDRPVEVTIEVPDGERLARKTFNSRLGIVGGISIIGTTGIVEPMSLEALKATVQCEIDIAVEEIKSNSKLKTQNLKLFFAPGKIGEDALRRIFGDVRVVQTSNFIGFALGYACSKGVNSIVLGGHPGKLAKILMGYYDTHSRNSPQATDFVARYMGLKGGFNTVEEIIKITKRSSAPLHKVEGRGMGWNRLASEIAIKIAGDFGLSHVEVYLFDMKKNLIGDGRWDG